RAVRVPRRADTAPAGRQGPADPAGAQADDAAHHPQYHRSGATLRSRRGDDLSARKGEAHRRYCLTTAAQLGNRFQRGIRALRRPDLGRSARGSKPRVAGAGKREAARGRGAMTAVALARTRCAPAALGLFSFVVLIALVELLIRIGLINRFIVPMPSDIIAAFPRVVVEEHVLQRFLLTASEAFSASILVTIFGVAGGVL